MRKQFCVLLWSGLPTMVLAQPQAGTSPVWGLGAAVAVNQSPYAGEGSRLTPIPLLNFDGEHFFFKGISAGWRLVGNDSFELAAFGKLRLDGFDVDDLGQSELAANGIDYRLLDDRKIAFDLGLGIKWSGRPGELEFELLGDVTATSAGQEASLQYGYPMRVGHGLLTPLLGLSWQSANMANYYYGTLDDEVARGVVDYQPGSIVMPHVGLQYFRPMAEHWVVMVFVKYASLPDAAQNSPLLDADAEAATSVLLGVSRGF